MELLVEIIMKSLFGEQIRKVIEEKYACKSEYWMLTESDEKANDFWSLGNGNYKVQLAQDEGKEDDNKKS